MAISNWMSALALINGTTGGIVIVLPIIGLDAGWLMIPILIFVAAICCYYTATLMFKHLGNAQTINKCIINHFSNPHFCEFYNLTMFVSFFGEMILYFDLLVSESEGFFYFSGQNIKYVLPFIITGFLILLAIVTRFFHFQDNLLGYGILSMIAYALFIAWIIINTQSGPKSLPIANDNFIDLGAAMSQGFSIHNMMIPIILRAKDPKNYKKILANIFIIGAFLYTFIAYGSFALVNRQPISGGGETVQDYFTGDEWQIYLLRTIYIINIITVFPEFLSISRIRFFNLFSAQQPQQSSLSIKQITYYIIVVCVCLIAKILKFRAPIIIQLNGSIICFMQIYLIPIGIHLKCIWLNYKKIDQLQYAIQNAPIEPNSKQFKQIVHTNAQNSQNLKTTQQKPNKQLIQDIDESLKQRCTYHEQIDSKKRTFKEIVKSLIVLFYGVFVMLYTFYTVFFKKES